MLVDLVREGSFEGEALELDEQDGRKPGEGQLFRGFAKNFAVWAFPDVIWGRECQLVVYVIPRGIKARGMELTRHQTSPSLLP